jgi:hypothetical protein
MAALLFAAVFLPVLVLLICVAAAKIDSGAAKLDDGHSAAH